jgi:hypothetical protein
VDVLGGEKEDLCCNVGIPLRLVLKRKISFLHFREHFFTKFEEKISETSMMWDNWGMRQENELCLIKYAF